MKGEIPRGRVEKGFFFPFSTVVDVFDLDLDPLSFSQLSVTQLRGTLPLHPPLNSHRNRRATQPLGRARVLRDGAAGAVWVTKNDTGGEEDRKKNGLDLDNAPAPPPPPPRLSMLFRDSNSAFASRSFLSLSRSRSIYPCRKDQNELENRTKTKKKKVKIFSSATLDGNHKTPLLNFASSPFSFFPPLKPPS